MNARALSDTRDVAAVMARAGVGLALIGVAWFQTADAVALERQTGWVALGAAGVVASSVSIALWVLQLRRSVTTRLVGLRERVDRLPLAAATAVDMGQYVRVDAAGVRRYHRAGCHLVSRKARVAGTQASFESDGYVACGVCIDV